MIEEIGTVTKVEGHRIEVMTQIKTTCSACQANEHCGTGVVARALNPKIQRLELDCFSPVEVGQTVTLGIPEQSLLKGSMLVYLLPIVGLVLGGVLGHWLSILTSVTGEGVTILLSLLFATVSWFLARVFIRRKEQQYLPQLLNVIPASIKITPVD